MEKAPRQPRISSDRTLNIRLLTTIGACSVLLYLLTVAVRHDRHLQTKGHPPRHAAATISRCHSLLAQVAAPKDFHKRSRSDRFVHGTKPVLIKRARIWTGRKNGTEVIRGDILLDKGLIKSVGSLHHGLLQAYSSDLIVVDAKDAWITPGIVDIHSHLGNSPSPALDGAEDGNSPKGTIQPWLRSLDGLNTHDASYPLSIAGGVTTSLILPGSGNAIGGQAFVIKLRSTTERTPTSMLLEPPYNINSSFPNPNLPPRWRHMKHACGENPNGQYKDTRMDTNWAFREAYKTAFDIKEKQDKYCSLALAGKWKDLGELPEDLQWEALVDVVRGKVKINAHCYEAVDLDALVRLSNEFKFPIAAFHHASEAYLVPDLLKKTYGGTPAIALFATNSRYKREAYRSSEFAPRILAQHGIKVLLKSDHPVSNSRHLLYEAQQAYYYGFPENLAIASVTSNSAEVMGMGHRIGYIQEGWDADLVIWDSHPLALGAIPSQVFIDGIPQLKSVHTVQKPKTFHESPKVPNFDKEAADAVKYEGLPPIAPKKLTSDLTVFTNVKSVYKRTLDAVEVLFSVNGLSDELGVAVARNGSLVCSGMHADCLIAFDAADATYVDLEGGSISPGLVSFGSPLGLHHIEAEDSTNDGDVFDPLVKGVPKILGGDTAIVRAVDGLLFGSRDAYLAYRFGVTSGITAPTHKNFYSGLGVAFSLGAAHKLEAGAVIQEVTGVHVSVRHFEKPSISTQIAALRRLLLGPQNGASGYWFKKVTEGKIPLVVEAHSADIIATLIILKREVEIETRKSMKMTITGAAEAHILAKELAEAGVGVILNPSRPFPYVWEDRRILPGPPLSRDGAIVKLMSHGVTVGIGCEEIWSARNLPFDVAWAAIEAGGRISRSQALAIGSVNIEKLLGVEVREEDGDLVATRGGELLDRESKVIGVLSARQGGIPHGGRGVKLKVRPLSTWTRTMAKKAAVVATRPITDFFTRKTAFNSTLSISDASSSTSRAYMDAVEIVSPVRSPKYLLPPPMPFVKPANSPTIASLSPRPSSAARQQRKSIFDSDSDVEQPAPAVYILRSPARPTSAGTTLISSPAPPRATEKFTTHSSPISNPKKKQRLSSPEPCSELVPTSQSDELDMAPTHSPQRDPLLVKRSVDEWRHSAISAPSLLVDDVFVDSLNKSAFNLHTTQPPPDRMSSLSPVPASPKALNPTTKAAQIIADIKARAYAESLQIRPETPVREFKDDLSDDSDDEMLPESPIRAKGKSTIISKKPFASSSRLSGRYSLRNRDHSPSPSRSKQVSASFPSSKRMRVAQTRTPIIPAAQTQKGKGKAYNPLDDLLKEKKRDDQRGKGSEALRQAEAALANRDAIIVDVDVDDDFTNEAAARKAVFEGRRLALKSSSPMAHDASESEQELDDEDRARLLGEQNGKAIVNMLDSDRASKQREKETEKPVGVPLWQVGEELDGFMDVDEVAPPTLNISNPHPIVSVLQGAIQRNDLVQAAMLIGTGAISSINLGENPVVIPYLCQLALSSEETTVSKSALQFLNHIWDTSIPPLPGISFVCILSTLARLGAQSAVLSSMGRSAPHTQHVSISSRTRDSVLYRLVWLVTASARSRRLSAEEMPDILMSMVLLANEPSSSPELQIEVMLSIDAVCGSIASGGDISAFSESTICTKLLKYVSTLEPVNKAYIVALLGSGTGRTQRIARWVAHGIITNKQAISPKRYTDLPPLFPLVVELTRKRTGNSESELGNFEQHENTDFVDMAFYVQILGVAITNVIGYVMEERNAPRPRPSSSHDTVAPAQPAEPPLALIRLAIENVHSKISDIRATHLDRSRTKGALKELSLRIYYQRQTALQSARTLHTYFTKRKKPNGASS